MHKIKAFKYRIYPTKKQAAILSMWLESCRWLYNYFLEERKVSWNNEQKYVSCYDQIGSLSALKKQHPFLSEVHSQVLQNVAMRIDRAFKFYFRRCKAGGKPGYPRFRGKGRYDSFTFSQSGFSLKGRVLKLSKIGIVKIVLHRSFEGTIKTCTIKRSPTGKWYATFIVSCEIDPLPINDQPVGIDVGLTYFAVFSDGRKVDSLKYFFKEKQALVKAQRKLSKQLEGTAERNAVKKVLLRIHERIVFKRNNFIHQLSQKIIRDFGIIAVENLNINRMVHKRCLAKSINDAAWAKFLNILAYKADWAGRQFIAVNPAYTSQDCSRCGHRQKLSLKHRTFSCPCCNLILNRDHNAALNILRLGTQSLGLTLEAPNLC